MQFPQSDLALEDPNGLLAVGGDLSPATLIQAYRRGIFPWFDESQPILWWTPSPRAVLLPAEFHMSRSLRRKMARSSWRLTCDSVFLQVVDACAAPRAAQDGTWITSAMREAYGRLHALGCAHSIEVWSDDELIGGLYGVRLGQVFFGESMFTRASDSSKMALAALVWLGRQGAISLIDCQMESAHLVRLGARLLPRAEFEKYLQQLITADDLSIIDDRRQRLPLDEQLGTRLPERVKELLL